LRLAVVSPFIDRRHGTERAVAELVERLARDYGCEIHLYSQKVSDLQLGVFAAGESGRQGSIRWHKVLSFPGPHLVKFIGWMVFNALARSRLFRPRGPSFDLVLSPGINCLHPDAVIVHVVFHRLRALAANQEADAAATTGLLRRLHRSAYYSLLATLERRVYANERVKLAAVSQRTATLLQSLFGRNDVCVIPNGVDTQEFSVQARTALRKDARKSRGMRDDELALLLIGNDWRVKGLPTILEAMALLSELPLKLIIAGADNASFFQERAAQLGIGDRCIWEQDAADVLELFAAADIYVSPSREDSFGLPVAEAMACGLPAVTSAFAGVSELVHDGVDGFVLQNPTDAQALSRIIRTLHADSNLRNKVGQAAAGTAQEWTWDRNAEALWKLIGTNKRIANHPTM
jgi:glycosyltransferase involved in cell wall biosynthesis